MVARASKKIARNEKYISRERNIFVLLKNWS